MKHIPGYKHYSITKNGRVYSHPRKGTSGGWKALRIGEDRYVYVTLTKKPEPNRPHRVHRLVLLAYVGPCPLGQEACHRNGDRADNRLSNLRWDTPASNCKDRDNGEHKPNHKGTRNGRCKLTKTQVLQILRDRRKGKSVNHYAADFGISTSHISNIGRRVWVHLKETNL